MDKDTIADTIEQGGVHARTIIQLVGKPKEHIEKSLEDFIDKLKEMPGAPFTIFNEEFHEAVEQEDSDSLFSTFCEVDVLCKTPQALTLFCFEAMPSSVEIQDPERIDFRSTDLTDMLNDFVTRMHQVDMIAKQTKQEAQIHLKSLGVMIQNAILILLNLGPRTSQSISEYVGIGEEQIARFLEKLIKDDKIEEVGDKYRLKKKTIE